LAASVECSVLSKSLTGQRTKLKRPAAKFGRVRALLPRLTRGKRGRFYQAISMICRFAHACAGRARTPRAGRLRPAA
jgi:hypothetical protein